jgi:hypothetical protein
MKKKRRFFFLFILLVFISLFKAYSQTTTADAGMASTQFDMSGFPLWAKDLRRGEIVAFGSFPFMYFFSNFGFDTYRWLNNGNDMRYAPWPFNSAGTVGKTTNEKIITLGIAAGGSILIAIIDHGIMRYKRNRLKREQSGLHDGSPVIIRRPLANEEEGADSAASAVAEAK